VSFESIAAPARRGGNVLQTLSPVLHEQRIPTRNFLDYARDKNVLLVLDNLEHLLEGRLIGALLARAYQGHRDLTQRLHLQWGVVVRGSGSEYPREAVEAVEAMGPCSCFCRQRGACDALHWPRSSRM
jgi:hypothetical protein